MNDHTFYYYVDRWLKHDKTTIEKRWCFEVKFHEIENDWDYDDLVEHCADDFYSNHDGWDCGEWTNNSIPFHLFDKDMVYIGKFDVYLEFNPTFFVSRL